MKTELANYLNAEADKTKSEQRNPTRPPEQILDESELQRDYLYLAKCFDNHNEALKEVTAQRDELLAALKALTQGIEDHGVKVKVEPDVFDSYVFRAEDVIAKCEASK